MTTRTNESPTIAGPTVDQPLPRMVEQVARWSSARPSRRVPVDGARTLDVHEWNRWCPIEVEAHGERSPWSDGKTVRYHVEPDLLLLSHELAAEPMTQRVPLLRTCRPADRDRLWFGCPECGRRVAKLYLRPAAGFVCRECAEWYFANRFQYVQDREQRVQAKIERRLGRGFARPRRMSVEEYQRLMARYDQSVQECRKVVEDTILAILGSR